VRAPTDHLHSRALAPCRSRRSGRGQRGHPGLARPDPDAGHDARPRERGALAVHRNVEPAGAFEAGLVAALVGTVPSVLLGGIGTIAVAVLWMLLFPELRRVRQFEE